MSGRQDSQPVISALRNVRRAIEVGRVERRRMLDQTFVFGFAVNSPALRPEHEEILDDVGEFLLDHPDAAVVSVVGRASQTGSEANNESLAFDRAQTVRAYLLAGGLPESRIGPVVAYGSGRPVIDVPGREAELNRSVELVIDWELVLVEPSLSTGAPGTTTHWKLDLTVTFGLGFGLGGQVQLGQLTNLDTSESRSCSISIAGLDLGHSLFITAAASPGLPVGADGEFTMPVPPGPVDFDWFDGRFVVLTAVGASAVVGGADLTKVRFWSPDGPWPEAGFAGYPIGVTVGIGGLAMVGFCNVR